MSLNKTLLSLTVGLGASITTAVAQVTYAEHIAPIIYKHCTNCHRPGEIGTMPLTNYQEVTAVGSLIQYVTNIKYMPPWKPDHTYSNFLGENFLTDTEIQQIADWVNGGMPRGNTAVEPTPPNYPTGSQVGTPDLVLSFAQAFTHPAGADDYHVFVLPTGLTQDRDVVAVEMRPGNPRVDHHALFSWDTSGTAAANDANTPEYGYTNFGGFGVTGAEARQFPSYVPGQKPRIYTNGVGQRLPAGADFLVQMHYGPTAVDEVDSTTVNLFFSPQPAARQAYQYVMLPSTLTNGPFVIPADSVKRFHGQYTVPFPVSLLSVGPHMHLLGKDWLVYAVHPNGDTTELIKLDNWDFHWQGGYNFKKFIKLETGTVIHAYATYDNTASNPNNPSNPPVQVQWGEFTTDEMFYLAFMFVIYQSGDEFITFPEDTVQLGPPLTANNVLINYPKNKLYPVYPNPAQNQVTIGFTLAEYTPIQVDLVDMNGRTIKVIQATQNYIAGNHIVQMNTEDLANGMYVVRVQGRNFALTEKLVIQKNE